jgi:hypothetical protein
MYGERQHETPCRNPECDNVVIWFYMPPTCCPTCLYDLGLDEYGSPHRRKRQMPDDTTDAAEPTVQDYADLGELKPKERGEDQ